MRNGLLQTEAACRPRSEMSDIYNRCDRYEWFVNRSAQAANAVRLRVTDRHFCFQSLACNASDSLLDAPILRSIYVGVGFPEESFCVSA